MILSMILFSVLAVTIIHYTHIHLYTSFTCVIAYTLTIPLCARMHTHTHTKTQTHTHTHLSVDSR